MRYIECGICKSNIEADVFRFDNMPLVAQNLPGKNSLSADYGTQFDLFLCHYCGVAFLDIEPVEYFREVIRAVGVSEVAKSAKQAQLSEFCSKYGLSNRKLIEIGCGDGAFLEILSKYTSNAFGLEYSTDSVIRCRSKGLNVYQGYITDEHYNICENRFSGFLLLMFLEHIPQPRAFLRGVYNNLEDDAIGLIEVPDSDMVFSKGLYAEIMRDHLYYYNLQSLSALVNSCGFEVVENNTIRDGYVLSLTVRKKQKKQLSEIGNYIKRVRATFQDVLDKYDNVAIWGASHQTFFLLSQIGDTTKISQIIDSAEFKQGKNSPVTHIPISKPSDTISHSAIIVSAGSYNAEIVDLIRKRYNYSGDVYVFELDTLHVV